MTNNETEQISLNQRVALRNKWFTPGVTLEGSPVQVMLSAATALDSTDDGMMKVRVFIEDEKYTFQGVVPEDVMNNMEELASHVHTTVVSWAMNVKKLLNGDD